MKREEIQFNKNDLLQAMKREEIQFKKIKKKK